MGQTNLRQALERKYSLMAGELGEKEREVARILTLFEELPTLNQRAERLRHLLICANDLLVEIAPGWTPQKVKAVVPHVHKALIPMGEIAKGALSVLRTAKRGLSSREIAIEILASHGVTDYEKPDLTRISNSVLASLKAKEGKIVEKSDSGFPFKWIVIAQP